MSKHRKHGSAVILYYAEEITERRREPSGETFLSFLFPNALSGSPCMVARHALIISLTGIAPPPVSPRHSFLLQIGFYLFFNMPFNAVSPNP